MLFVVGVICFCCSLFVGWLVVVCCVMCFFDCVLFVVCLLFVVCCLLCVELCSLFVVRWLFFVVCGLLFVVRC